jgi:hypothetical protein
MSEVLDAEKGKEEIIKRLFRQYSENILDAVENGMRYSEAIKVKTLVDEVERQIIKKYYRLKYAEGAELGKTEQETDIMLGLALEFHAGMGKISSKLEKDFNMHIDWDKVGEINFELTRGKGV